MSRRSEHTTKVFVGSLPPNVTVEDLRQLFAPFGEIAECDIANRCGFLHLENKDLATKAIEELNNSTFMGGRISVEKGRVKPRGERRMRNSRGGGGGGEGRGGRRRDSGPYSRDGGGGGGGGGYMRGGPPRNGGGYEQPEYGYGSDYRGDYPQRGGYDDGYERRPPMYDERRGGGGGGYMGGERRPYNNGYDRRGYDDRGGYPEPQRSGYDERRMPPGGPTGYDDRRPPINDRRPLIDDQSMGQGAMRPPMNSYDRAPPSNDMYSRRESANKPLTGGYDRQPAQGSYAGNYGSTTNTTGYPTNQSSGYGGAPANTGYTQQATPSYGDNRGTTGGYMDTRQATPAASGYSTQQASGGYSNAPSGGYGDNYGMRSNPTTYDTAYPPLPQQRGFAGGNGQGPQRDMPSTRRY